MKYQLQLKPFEKKEGIKYKIIQITDIALHSSNRRPTISIGQKIQRAFIQKKPDRIYGLKPQRLTGEPNPNEVALEFNPNDPELVKMIKKEEKKGFKILIELPKNGIPLTAGKDLKEFMERKNGQRIIRGLAKKEKKV